MADYNKEEVFAFIDRLEKAITTRELRKQFPSLSRGSADRFLRKKHRFTPERLVLPVQKPVAAVLDTSINYHDAERRAATRERIKANRG